MERSQNSVRVERGGRERQKERRLPGESGRSFTNYPIFSSLPKVSKILLG